MCCPFFVCETTIVILFCDSSSRIRDIQSANVIFICHCLSFPILNIQPHTPYSFISFHVLIILLFENTFDLFRLSCNADNLCLPLSLSLFLSFFICLFFILAVSANYIQRTIHNYNTSYKSTKFILLANKRQVNI